MLQPRYRKILRDLYNYKTRTLLVVLSIAVGVVLPSIRVSKHDVLPLLSDIGCFIGEGVHEDSQQSVQTRRFLQVSVIGTDGLALFVFV